MSHSPCDWVLISGRHGKQVTPSKWPGTGCGTLDGLPLSLDGGSCDSHPETLKAVHQAGP